MDIRQILEASDFYSNLTAALSALSLDKLSNPTLNLQIFIQEGNSVDGDTFKANEQPTTLPRHLLLSHKIPLRVGTGTCGNQLSNPSFASRDASPEHRRTPANRRRIEVQRQKGSESHQTHKSQGGLRLATVNGNVPVEDDGVATESPRQMQVGQENFPKRVKVKHDGVFHPRESSLGKFVVGVWEQIHSGLILEPHVLTEQVQLTSQSSGKVPSGDVVSAASGIRPDQTWDSFSRSNVFCRRVTQASRTCRSIEVIVQARWVELFDSYVEYLASTNPNLSLTKCRMRALAEACADFGWIEKELRNKMAIWRGYKEIKDVLGWVALVFSGMGLYRLCKYRIDFDKEKLTRARTLRMRMEVAADTIHKNWRQLLAIVGESTETRFVGHPHDWVVHQDGSDPVPLRSTYLKYDSNFTFEHLDESIIDIASWGADDPRWTPPSTAVCVPGVNICDLCSEVQSNESAVNACKCFPNLFGVPRLPTAVQVFRTSNGRNNGLQALVAFERGTAIGEFVGLITKDIEEQDVLDSKVGGRRYQIWQGKQGNFTRFANHSCKPNAQFEKFVWLGTQHILMDTEEGPRNRDHVLNKFFARALDISRSADGMDWNVGQMAGFVDPDEKAPITTSREFIAPGEMGDTHSSTSRSHHIVQQREKGCGHRPKPDDTFIEQAFATHNRGQFPPQGRGRGHGNTPA